MTLLTDNDLHHSLPYIRVFVLTHLEGQPVRGAVQAQVVTAGQHEDIFGCAAASGARLGVVLIAHSSRCVGIIL